MNPLTHALTGWVLGQTFTESRRDSWLITLGTLAPDLDGLGILVERATAGTASPLNWYTDFHHLLSHNLLAGLITAGAAALVARQRLRTGIAVVIGFHLHLLEDIVGSGGPDGERWTIPYLWPWRSDLIIDWPGQWPIEAWPNLLLTFFLILLTLRFARNRGYSPLALLSSRADAELVRTLRRRFPLSVQESSHETSPPGDLAQ